MPGGLCCETIRQTQVNIGRRCNLSCTHCHLDCAPERTEEMDPATMDKVIELAASTVRNSTSGLLQWADTALAVLLAQAPHAAMRWQEPVNGRPFIFQSA